MDVTTVILALLTLAAGAVAGWALARSRSSADAAAAQAQRDAAVADVAGLRGERDQLAAALRSAEGEARELAARLEVEQRTSSERLDDARRGAAERLEHERTAAAARLTELTESTESLKDSFARLSQEALTRSNTAFLELADSRFTLAGKPMTETLGKVELQLREIEKERAGAAAALTAQIETVRTVGDGLRDQTAALVSALRKPQARGRWGELQLRRCLDIAGMTDRSDFLEQASVTTEAGVLRPDLVISLVGDKHVVVDSKVTLAAYLEAHDATEDSVREERLNAHARHLRQHVDSLAAKSYWSQFSPAPEFVMLFVPGEAFLAPALDRDPTLLEDAFRKRVHIVTPTSLISALRTVAYAWQSENLAANAQQVLDLGRELYGRLGTMGGHMDTLGRSLTSAVTNYNKTVGSLEKQVLVSARRLNELDIVEEPLAEHIGIEATVRPLTKPELLESAAAARAVVALPPADGATASQPVIIERDRLEDYGVG